MGESMNAKEPVYPVPVDDSQYYGLMNRDHIAIEAMKAILPCFVTRRPSGAVDLGDLSHAVSLSYHVANLMIMKSLAIDEKD